MAAIASDLVEIIVNDIPLRVPKGEIIVEAVKRIGLEIPIFCYHPRLKPVGMCRMCLVETGMRQQDGSIRMMPKPQAACTLPASEGLVIVTDNPSIRKDRRGVLEFLLINHPLDCPICDRGGECPLQNNTIFYGPSTSRYIEHKRHAHKAYRLSEHVTLDLERCIQCGRCVRFTEEISGDSGLAFRFRGASMQPSSFQLGDFDSKFSGNVIEICPVGALTSSGYRFRARPWDLETRPAICTVCGNGCNVWFDYRAGKMVRINGRTNEAVNEEWTCDRGKFGHEFYNSELRIGAPTVRRGEEMIPCDWTEALNLVNKAFSVGGGQVAALGGANVSNEDAYMLQKLFRTGFGAENLDSRFGVKLPKAGEHSPAPTPISAYEHAKAVLVFGCSLADEEPILFLRLRKGWVNQGTKVVVASSKTTDADAFAHTVLRFKDGTDVAAAKALLSAIKGKPDAKLAEEAGLSMDALTSAAEALAGAEAPVVSSSSIYRSESGVETAATLAALAKSLKGTLNIYGLAANEAGAIEMGMVPGENGADTNDIMRLCAEGKIKALWLAGVDPLAEHPNRELVQKALENVEFLVVQAHTQTECCQYASVILPMTAPAEADGTFTSVERRVQRMGRVLEPKGQAKPVWRVCAELLYSIRGGSPIFSAREVMDVIASEKEAFRGAAYDSLPPEGFLAPR